MSESVGAKLRRNTRAGMLTWAWGQAVMMVRMAVYYRYLGEEGYGLWFLAFSIMSYFVFYNFGINNAFIKYTAEYHAKKDYEGLNHMLSTGLVGALAMAASILIILFVFTEPVIAFFEFDPKNVGDAIFVVKGIGIVTAFTVGAGIYASVLNGIQRLDVLNACRVSFITVEVAVAFVLLFLDYGIRALVFTYGASVVLSFLAMGFFAHRYLPELRLNPMLARRACVKGMASLGGRMQILGAVALLVATIDGIVFAKFEGLAFLGVYAIARRVADRAQGAALQAFGALTPASADLIARQDYDKLSDVYGTAMRICCTGCAYLFGFIAINSDFTMIFFQGADQYNPLSAGALTFLCGALAIHTLTGPGSSMLRGAGHTLREISYHIITMAIFLAFFYYTRRTGQPGGIIVLSYPVGVGLGSLFFIVVANRFFRVFPLMPFHRMILLAASGPAAAWLLRAGWDGLGLDFTVSRWTAMAAIIALGIPYTGLFSLAAWFLPGLTARDKAQILKFVPGAHGVLSRFLPTP